MAIVVEEERKPVNWMAIISTLLVIVILFLGSYFLFFKKPELIEVITPGSLESVSKLSKLSFDPQTVISNSTFKLLKQFGVGISPPQPGRPNPFKPF